MGLDLFKLSGAVDVTIGKAEANLKRVDSAARTSQQNLSKTGDAAKRIGRDFDQAAGGAGRLGSAMAGLKSRLSGAFTGTGGAGGGGVLGDLLKSNVIASGVNLLTNSLKEGFAAGIEYNKMLETATVRFSRFFGGSTEMSKAFRDEIAKFAKDSPIFELPQALTGAQRLLQMKVAAKDVPKALESIADAVGGVGGNAESIDRVTLALSQMVSTGRIQADEMNQLTEAGLPAWELLAKAIGKTEAETRKLSEAGRIDATIGAKGIIAMMGETFAGQSALAGKTFAGKESQLRSTVVERLGQATKENFEQISASMDKAVSALGGEQGGKLTESVSKLMAREGADAQKQFEQLLNPQSFDQMARGVGALDDALKGTLNVLKGNMQEGGKQLGAAISEGFKIGLGESSDPIDRAVYDFFGNVINRAKDILGVKSPSTVFAQIGQDVVEGFNQGVTQNIDRSSQGIKRWAKAIEKAGGEEFLKAVEAMAKRLNVDPNKLLNVMAFESRINPAAKNPKSSATGLIQFMAATAEGLGTTVDKLRNMDAIAQLQYVEAYFRQFKRLADTQESLYTAVLAGRPVSDPNAVLFREGTRAFAANRGLDRDASGTITAGEAAARTRAQGFLNSTTAARRAIGKMAIGALGSMTGIELPFGAPPLTGTSMASKIELPFGAPPLTGTSMLAEVPKSLGELGKETTKAKAAIEALPPPLKETAAAATVASSQAGKFANAIKSAGKTWEEAMKDFEQELDLRMSGGERFKRFQQFSERIGDGFDDLIDNIMEGGKNLQDSLKNIFKDIFKGLINELTLQATGGRYGSPGQAVGGAIGGLFGGIFRGGAGGGGAAAGGGGGGIGGAIQQAIGGGGGGGGGGLGGLLGKIPGIGKIFGGSGGGGGGLGGLIMGGDTGAGVSPGTVGGVGGGGSFGGKYGGLLSAGGAIAGSFVGRKSGFGRLLGGLGGSILANPASWANPYALAAGAALLGAGALFGIFGGGQRILKSLRGLIRGEYGIEVKSNQVLENIKALGESAFGKEFKKKQIETVRLPDVRELLASYAERTNQKGNSKLFSLGDLQDPYSAGNSFPRRMWGGPLAAFQAAIVGERGPELFVPHSAGRVVPNGQMQGGGERDSMMMDVLMEVAMAIRGLRGIPKGHLVEQGLAERPEAATRAVEQSFRRRSPGSLAVRDLVNAR